MNGLNAMVSSSGIADCSGKIGKLAQFSGMCNELDITAVNNLSAVSEAVLGKVTERLRSCAMRVPTGIEFFDEMSGGGIYNGLNVIAGMPNVGKTTFLVQLAVELSKAGRPVVFMSKDMSMTEIMLKAISYVSGAYLHRTLDINEVAEALREGSLPTDVTDVFGDVCRNLHIRELRVGADIAFEHVADVIVNEAKSDADDDASRDDETAPKSTDVPFGCLGLMGNIFEIYSKVYDEKPVFIIDSLQSVSLDTGESGKGGVDFALSYIKYWQMQCNAPVIVVSNLNRASYDKGDITISSLKESGNIEYDASSVWCICGMDALHECRESVIRDIRFINLKDRAAGACENTVKFNVLLGCFYTEDNKPVTQNFSVANQVFG